MKRRYDDMPAKFIYGFRKFIADSGMLRRLYFKTSCRYGIFRAPGIIRKYFRNKKCLFNDAPARYVKAGRNIFAIPDLPPLNSSLFAQYILEDLAVVLENKKPPLLFAIVCITSRCPYKCPYCYNSDMHTDYELLSFELLQATISGLIETGIHNIYLSGGEPMMRYNDLIRLLGSFAEKKIGFWLLSTGYGLNFEKLYELKQSGLRGVMISLDHYQPEIINKVKGSPNAFNYAVSAIENANKAGLVVAIDSVSGKDLLTDDGFRTFVKFAGDHGAHFINCYTPRRFQTDLDPGFTNFTMDEFIQLSRLTRENQMLKKHLPVTNSPDAWESTRGCMGGKLFIYIDPQGNVKPCPFVKLSAGNIKEKGIGEILKEMHQSLPDFRCRTMEMIEGKL
ncbi:MAG: radical SAM protein [Bacteroidota bacterium]